MTATTTSRRLFSPASPRTLDPFDEIVREGSNSVVDHVAQLTGVDADAKASGTDDLL